MKIQKIKILKWRWSTTSVRSY